jgi:hypothetical protein
MLKSFAGLVAVVFVCFASFAAADDWMMFRKDSARAATSTDSVKLPLKTLWEWKAQAVKGETVLSTAAIRKGQAFFIAGPKTIPDSPKKDEKALQRILFCVDLKSGDVKWQRPLVASRMHPYLAEDIGPVVTASGTVYVLDRADGKADCAQAYSVSAFSADKGKPLGIVSAPIRESLSRFFIRDGHGEANFLLTSKMKPDC